MKIFLCWSGDLSRQVAHMFRNDLKKLFPKLQIFMSEADIKPGEIWFIKLLKELKETHFGIVFLTPENIKNQWIHFETGALTKHLNGKDYGKACGLLLKNLPSDQVIGPLHNFQNKHFDKPGLKSIILTINKKLRPSSSEEKLSRNFEKLWPNIWKKYKLLLNKNITKDNEENKSGYLSIWREFTDIANVNHLILGTETRRTDWIQQQTTINQAHAMSLIWSLLENISSSHKNLYTSQFTPKTGLIGNEIIIGGPKNNAWTRTLIEKIKSQHHLNIFIGENPDDFGNMISISSLDGKKLFFGPNDTKPDYDGAGDVKEVKKDLGIIIIKKQGDKKTIAIAGCHSLGTLAAAQAITIETSIREKINPSFLKGINSKKADLKIMIVETYQNSAEMPRLVFP
jgi:hypothetical protein